MSGLLPFPGEKQGGERKAVRIGIKTKMNKTGWQWLSSVAGPDHPLPCPHPVPWGGWVMETPLNRPWQMGEKLQERGGYGLPHRWETSCQTRTGFPASTSITSPHCLHWAFRSPRPPASSCLTAILNSLEASVRFLENNANRRGSCRATKTPKRNTCSIWLFTQV